MSTSPPPDPQKTPEKNHEELKNNNLLLRIRGLQLMYFHQRDAPDFTLTREPHPEKGGLPVLEIKIG